MCIKQLAFHCETGKQIIFLTGKGEIRMCCGVRIFSSTSGILEKILKKNKSTSSLVVTLMKVDLISKGHKEHQDAVFC